MHTKDRMIQLTYQIEKNIDDLTLLENEFINDYDSNEKLNYLRSKKRKGDEIEQILNCRIMEFYDGHSYNLPKEFVALWSVLLSDFTFENGAQMKDILKALKPGTSKAQANISPIIIEQLRLGLQFSYAKVYGDEVHEVNVDELIDRQIRVIQENYHFNFEKRKIEKEIQSLIKEAFSTKFGQPNQYTIEKNSFNNTELYPFGELTLEQQLEKMSELKNQIKLQLENW